MYFKTNIRYLRNKAGYTLEEVANKLGYSSYTTVQKWEAGTSEPRMDVVQKVARLFNVPMDQLINFDLKEMDIKNSKQHYITPDNTMRYYIDILEKNEDLQTLIMESKDASPQQIQQALKIIKALKQEV